MKLIDRYVYDVIRRLPEDQREEVKLELEANINDMLSDDASDDEIKQVLLNLGHPRTLASNYRGSERHLIAPEWLDDYFIVLKINLLVFGILGFIGGLFESLLSLQFTTIFASFVTVLASVIESSFTSMLTGFALATVIFVIISYFSKNHEMKFDPERLPLPPASKNSAIKLSGTIVSLVINLVFGVVFLMLIANDQFHVFWISDGFQINANNAIFTQTVIMGLFPLLVTSVIVAVARDIYFLFVRSWNIRAFIVHAFAKIFTAVVTIIVLNTNDLINFSLIQEMATYVDISAATLADYIAKGLMGLSILVAIGGASELFGTAVKKLSRDKF